ncbi:agmatine/peptidylarginine deiminase [Streptomyces monticola]|uniref:Agmatine/peptidylarginine deiminase n=1 Tax=Streptomyces monticola TaxID=2666263 RepID=A0ABW2JKU7_9ACTN
MAMNRRQALLTAALTALGGSAAACGTGGTHGSDTGTRTRARTDAGPLPAGLRMPDEAHPHARTFMAWPHAAVWGGDTEGVRADIARIARTVAGFEPVTLLAGKRDAEGARKACGSTVDVVGIPVDDLWMRDTGPTFVLREDGRPAGLDLHFNGWGGKQEHGLDRQVARRLLAHEGLERIPAPLVAEGGSLEVDGAGTLLVTESSLVNDNRNKGTSRAAVEDGLKAMLGVREVIWLKGLKSEDITDYHVDSLARFAAPGVVVLNTPAPGAPRDVWLKAYEEARSVLRSAVDARGKGLEVVALPEPADIGRRGPDFLASYVNYYVINGAVLAPRFGDRKADDRAAGVLRELYPGRRVVQLPVDTLAEGGGSIHCSTQQLPRGTDSDR